MRNRGILAIAGLGVALLMALAVGSASANRLSLSNRAFRIVWPAANISDSGGSITVSCPLTLEGSFHSSTFVKILNILIGYVTRAAPTTASCTGGNATFLTATLPWHVTYKVFFGTLPNITGFTLLLIGFAAQIEVLGLRCLFRTTATESVDLRGVREAGGNITTLEFEPGFKIPFSGGFCPALAQMTGAGNVTLLGNTTRIRLTLI